MKNKKKISFWIFILILLLNASAGKALNPNIDTNLTLNNSNKLTIENPNENIGLIQRDYLADGTVIEKAQGLILDEDSTPGVEEGDNPLGVEQMRFLAINEIAFVCPGLTNNFVDLDHVDVNLIENQINDPEFDTMLDATCSYEGAGCIATDAASGDVNGDDQDELVIIDKFGRVYIYEYNTSTHLFTQQVYNLDINTDDTSQHYSISLNQFNLDPGLEIAIGCGHQDKIQIWDPVNALGTYYTPGVRNSISGVDGGVAEVDLRIFLDPVHDVVLMDIETGDFNGNGYMDIVGLGARGDLFVVELDSGVLNLIGGPIALSGNQVQGYTHNFPQAIGIGDYNGDFLPDIAVMKCITIGGGVDFSTNYYVDTIYWKGFDCGGTVLNNLAEVDVSAYNCFYPSIGMGDVDGDGLYETIVSGKIGNELNTDDWVVMFFEDFKNKLTGPKATFTGEGQCPWAAKSFACTDVDLDGVDEICFSSVERYGNVWYGGATPYLIQTQGRHTSIVKFNSNANPWDATVLYTNENIIGFPVLGDYDGDGIVLEYSGNHYPRFTPQMPIFVLAAPPTYFDLNGDGSGSSVSTSQSTTTDVSEQFSVMAGIKVSFESGFEIFGHGVKFRASVEANYQFTQTRTNMESETIGIQYSSGYEDNQIIYNVVDYESYIYNIVKHPFNDMIGKNMSIDIPIGVNIYSTTESLYENSGSGTNVIGPETFNHIIGKPGTYPTLEEVNEYTGVVQILEKTVVPQGSSINCGTTLSYIREEASSVEKEHSMSLTFSTGVEVGGFGLDVSVGYGHSWSNKVTYGKSMAYDGSVSCIGDESSWSENKYFWGMFIQNIEPDAGFSFQLIHYYTEGNFTNGILDKITDFISENPVQSIAIGIGGIGVITGVVLIAKRKGRGKR